MFPSTMIQCRHKPELSLVMVGSSGCGVSLKAVRTLYLIGERFVGEKFPRRKFYLNFFWSLFGG